MHNQPGDFQCYSIRRLNPFQGMVQIVRTPNSLATSINGIDWDVQILAEPPYDTWGLASPIKTEYRFLRFGSWNSDQGLTGVPANPLLNLTRMITESNHLVEILIGTSAQIPFPATDRFELWLMDDSDQQPRALLASTVDEDHLTAHTKSEWIASTNEFPSTHLQNYYSRHAVVADRTPNKHYLEEVIRQRTSRAMQCWFKRTKDGGGTPISATTELATNNIGQLPAEAFPVLLLGDHWNNRLAESVVSDYYAWLSPYLLTLQHLPDAVRSELEILAVKQAFAVEACWRLYPKIIDRRMIDTARVAAKLARSSKR